MVISNYTPANQPIVLGSLNPKFIGAVTVSTGPVQAQGETVAYPPYWVTVQPPPLTKDIGGMEVKVDFPPVKIQVSPPAKVVTVAVPAKQTILNYFESVGIVDGNPIRLCTLVKPGLVAAAHHYPLSPGLNITFYGSGDKKQTAKIRGVANTFGDLELYTLDQQVNVVMPARLPPLLTASEYAGKETIGFGLVGSRKTSPYNWVPAASKFRLVRVTLERGGVWTATLTASDGKTYLEEGDSGAPEFVNIGGDYYLLGVHRKIGSLIQTNMVAPWVNQINSL